MKTFHKIVGLILAVAVMGSTGLSFAFYLHGDVVRAIFWSVIALLMLMAQRERASE